MKNIILLSICLLTLPYQIFSQDVSKPEVLTWQDCTKEAIINHPDLIASREILNQSKASRKESLSTFFPQIGVNANVGESKSYPNFNAQNSYSYDFTAQQLLFNGFQTFYALDAANQNILAAQFNYNTA